MHRALTHLPHLPVREHLRPVPTSCHAALGSLLPYTSKHPTIPPLAYPHPIASSMDSEIIAKKYSILESRGILKHLDRKGILDVADDKFSLPFHARTLLHDDFLLTLSQEGIPAPVQFFDIMKETGAVVSGSFVTTFFEPELVRSWRASPRYIGPGDVDIYVGQGKLEDALQRMARLPGTEMIVVQTSTRQPPHINDDGNIHHPPRDDVIYNNSAIDRMARVSFANANAVTGHMDIMESISSSPIMPIARFDLTHLRCGISAEGYFDLHPNWHPANSTFASPRAIASAQAANPTSYFLKKYEDRGYHINDTGVVDGMGDHECEVSFDCPLTLRNSADGGVRFVPFTQDAAILACSAIPKTLRDPVVYWKHGGSCKQRQEDVVKPELFDSDGISSENRPDI